MLRSNQLLNSVFSFTAGIALGLAAANYFTAADPAGNASTASASPSQTEVVEAVDTVSHVSLATDKVPNTQVDNNSATAREHVADVASNIDHDLLASGVDIGLVEAADINRQETATTEASPEELASQPLIESTTRLDDEQTREQETRLIQESANTAYLAPQDDTGLLGHEML